ncbi:MAG: phasin family protein [Gammaproteobacteria bacterium]|nr:phasin family protein [Gammaproteobacteria bacterium]
MVAKKRKAKQKDSEKMVYEVREQLENAFLAGLGAFSNAQQAGGKTFDKLVEEGEKFRKKTTRKTESLIDDVQDAIREMTDDAQSKASGLMKQVRGEARRNQLTEIFDKQIASAMKRLQIATKKDIDGINRKLNKIEKMLEKQRPVAAKKAVPKRATASKPQTPIRKTTPRQAA